ncbi:clotting factor B [Trichonephila clavata]|uniref:Clotting factor B n=1 Tax=Trichonephila clavata TaxID=2740835 RepID=A0A8X6LYQ5_TRICU|nr:clotting factor B [Trichonephila clavata]
MYLFILKLILLASFHLYSASSVRFPTQRRILCPSSGDLCIEITSCPAALTGFRAGKQPKLCGWRKEVPQVCCPQDNGKEDVPPPDVEVQNRANKISSISPKGCGIRRLVPGLIIPPNPLAVTDPPIDIEPRKAAEDNSSFPPVDLSGVFSIQYAVGGVAIFNGNNKKQLCGGTVIDERHVITASHCFVGKSLNPNLYSVQVGEILLNESNPRYEVQEIKMHENYRPRYYYYDIAIIRLSRPLPEDVIPACLPGEDMALEGDNVTVLGWGDLSFGGPSSNELQEVQGIPVIGNKACNSKYKKISGPQFPRGITEDFICAGLEEGGKDACQGDSGGPLLREYSEGHWALVGVVSFGYMCCGTRFSRSLHKSL